MQMWTPLSKEQADKLFKANAVLFGQIDRVPMKRARELLGDMAVNSARRALVQPKDLYVDNGLSVEEFRQAVTYLNCENERRNPRGAND